MKKEEFEILKEKFIMKQIDGRKYDPKNGILLPKDYVEKNKENIVVLKFYVKNTKKGKYEQIDIRDIDRIHKIRIAVCKAYEDSQKRLIRGHEKITTYLYEWENKDYSPLGYLGKCVNDILEKGNITKETYDKWHKTTSEHFIDKLNKLISDKISPDENQEIGKAQKVINMTFKYLYCMLDEKELLIFKHCHMPLDHYTLEFH